MSQPSSGPVPGLPADHSLRIGAPRVLVVPSHVHLRYVDLSIELQVLGFYRARQSGPDQRVAVDSGDVPLLRSVGLSASSDVG